MQELVTKWAYREVTTEADGREFIDDCERIIGGGFHPDTRFDDYGRRVDGVWVVSFTDLEAARLDACLDQTFAVLGEVGVDVYELSLDLYHHYQNMEEGQ